jgi:D-alanyl-D-alanine endopeptidase (penicillin-binding protein 7)
MGTGLNFVHLAPFRHKAFDSNSAILQNASVFGENPCTANDIPTFSEPQRENIPVHPQPAAVAHRYRDPSVDCCCTTPAQVQRDPSKLHLASGSALLIDLNTNQELYSSHADRVVPIASVTKLMTAMVVLDAKLPMDEMLTMTIANNPEMKGVYSRVRLGSQLDRRETLLITLMSSENRAANSLANAYPGGYPAFIRPMNAKARSLGMAHTRYVEPTGLSTQNVSTARDLAKLLMASRKYPMLSELSTTREKTVAFRKPNYTLGFRNTDHLVNKSNWDIKLTKTGFTNEAGHCLVLLTRMDNRPVAMVILDAFGKYTHFADASRMRQWLETGAAKPAPAVAMQYKADRQNKGRLAAE